jgi:hypothetical protein
MGISGAGCRRPGRDLRRDRVPAPGARTLRLGILALSFAAAGGSARADCVNRAHGEIIARGVVAHLGTVQIEPAETPQTYFTLERARWLCGRQPLYVHVPGGFIPCAEGDEARVRGDYLPPGPIGGNGMIEARQDNVRCRPPRR